MHKNEATTHEAENEAEANNYEAKNKVKTVKFGLDPASRLNIPVWKYGENIIKHEMYVYTERKFTESTTSKPSIICKITFTLHISAILKRAAKLRRATINCCCK